VTYCTAEPFGFGPSSSLAQILAFLSQKMAGHGFTYIGTGHSIDLQKRLSHYQGRIIDCDSSMASGYQQMQAQFKPNDLLISVCDFNAAKAANEAGIDTLIYDPLAWYWKQIPAICSEVDLYICQDFFNTKQQLAESHIKNAVVVPAFTPDIPPNDERNDFLLSLGGLSNPLFQETECTDYARILFAAAQRLFYPIR